MPMPTLGYRPYCTYSQNSRGTDSLTVTPLLFHRLGTGYARGPASPVPSDWPTPVNAPGLVSLSLRLQDPVVQRLRTIDIAAQTLHICFSVFFPSFLPFSCKPSRVKGGVPWPGFSLCPLHYLCKQECIIWRAFIASVSPFPFPPWSPSTKTPIIPSLRHRHSTISYTVLQQSVRISLLSNQYLFIFIDQHSFIVLNWLFMVLMNLF